MNNLSFVEDHKERGEWEMKYKPMPYPRLGSAGPCVFQGVVDIAGRPFAVWIAPDFDDRNKRIDAIHIVEFEVASK